MSQIEHKKVRAASARPPALRPKSGKSKRMHQKTQFIENVYGSNYQSFKKSKLSSMKYGLGQSEIEDINKLLPKADKITKDRQQLFEENLLLKKEINRLKDQLIRAKGKADTLANKNQKYTKQLNMEFEKKMYWTGHNSYLIAGIKAQYDKLKEEFQEKNYECQELKRQLIATQAPQFKVYAQTLQEENKKLVQKISKMSEISEQILFDNQNEKGIPEYAYTELEEKMEKLAGKLKENQYRLKISQQDNKDQQKKIQFLEKLVIEKDNAQYHAVKKAKKLQREKIGLEQQIHNLQLQMEQITKTYGAKIERLRSTEEHRYKTEKEIFDRTLSEKQGKITKLQKQVAYLSTLLTYWKPLDEINRDVDQPLNQSDNQKDSSFLHVQNDMKRSTRPRKPSEQRSLKNDFILKNSSQIPADIQPVKIEKKVRIQQTADQRHSENAEKKRRVEHNEIQHLGQHLRYRFLGLSLTLEKVKEYFSYASGEFIISERNQENDKWSEEYITMGEAKKTLMQYPFELKDEEAHILARYLVEDSSNEHVYCDENNQHKRSVVKSIIKALVGDYDILSGERQTQVKEECDAMLQKYQTNLLSALSTMASSGFISRRKFLELLSSLGIELSEEGKDYLVCKMLLESENLHRLKYMVIL